MNRAARLVEIAREMGDLERRHSALLAEFAALASDAPVARARTSSPRVEWKRIDAVDARLRHLFVDGACVCRAGRRRAHKMVLCQPPSTRLDACVACSRWVRENLPTR